MTSFRALWLMVSLAFKADPIGAVGLCLAMPVYYLSPAAGALATGALVDAAVDNRLGDAIWAGAFAAFSVLAAAGSLKLEVYLGYTIEKKVNVLVQRRLAEMLVRLPGIEHYERPDYLDEVQQLRDQAGNLGSGLLAALNLFAQSCQMIVVCVLLAAQTPLLLFLPLFAVPSFVAAAIGNRLTRQASERSAESDRLSHRIVGLVGELPIAREARLFGLGPDLRERRRRLASKVDDIRGGALVRTTLLGLAGNLVFAIGYFGAVVLVIDRALQGQLSAGDVVLTIVLAGQAHGFISGLVTGARFIAGIHIVAARLGWLEAYEKEQATNRGELAPPDELETGIELDDVSFRYPGTEPAVLSGLSASLPSGSVVALVGENGAGKSSLVKLLLAFYAPTSGRIRVDGTDLKEFDVEGWRSRTSGAFQDHQPFEFVARESIGLGDVRRIDDDGVVRQAVERAHATAVIDVLPNGLDTQLGASWPDGVDLSGGQWQRIALARAAVREHPLVLVLDEPSAALDAHAEHALFEGFAAATEQARQNGGITLLVTHRFSTVRMADLILVLDDGRIRKSGSHAELLENDDLYAELFRLQAAAYE